MVKHTQTIRRQKSMNCLRVFDHFVGLALKRLRNTFPIHWSLDAFLLVQFKLLHRKLCKGKGMEILRFTLFAPNILHGSHGKLRPRFQWFYFRKNYELILRLQETNHVFANSNFFPAIDQNLKQKRKRGV